MSQPKRLDSDHTEALPGASAAGPAVTKDHQPVAILILMVGLPGAGKTTRAKELAATYQALRLTPDHWMIPLFGDNMADGKRFVLEGRLISVALQALRLGTSVVLRLRALGPRRAVGAALAGPSERSGMPSGLSARGEGRPAGPHRTAPGGGTARDVFDDRGRR